MASMHTQALLTGAPQALPNRDGRRVVATVNDDAISLDEFLAELGPSADRVRLRQGRATAEELALLDRLITIRLVVQEGTTMGLDELPEIQKQVDVSSRAILREVLFETLVKHVTPDPAAVEKEFRTLVKEWKTTSLLFTANEAAQRARKEIGDGAAFTDVAARALAAKSARTDGDDNYHARKDYLPQIASAIAPLKVGQVSPVIPIPAGFVVVKVVAVRYPENAKARAEARKAVLIRQQQAALKVHDDSLIKRYAVVNQQVLKSLDYEAVRPGIDALLKDTRVVAGIKGAAPVTVADLTDYLRMQFFHGGDRVRQGREMNKKKQAALDATLERRLLNLEASKLGLDRTHAYRDRIGAYRDSLIFDAFVQRAIVPHNKMKEEEVKRYYAGQPKEYAYPEMLKIRSLAFARRSAAENALRKLTEGAEYGWVLANADEQMGADAKELLTFDGRPVTADSMPAGVQKALAGARAGEFRLYASPDGPVYVLAIQQVIASNPKPYDEVREDIARKLYGDKLKKSVDEYAGKLRARSKVTTYLKRTR